MYLDPLGPLGPLALIYFRILDPFGPFWDPWPLYVWDVGIFRTLFKKVSQNGSFFDQLFLKKSTSHKVLGPSHYAKKMRIWILSISTFHYFFDFSPTS